MTGGLGGSGELATAAQMAAALRRGEVSSEDLVSRALQRAESWQPATNAFSQLWPEEALGEARQIDAGRAGRGTEDRPLAGVPIAVKDLYDVAGHETTGCCRAYQGNVAESDAPVVARVRAAGLVMIGKTNQHELAAGGTNLASALGRTGNPWDPTRITGGSSGGSGAAVAAGVVPWALGSDTGGSIRIPAALCGIFGLKPTTGRLPLEGVMPLAPSMDCPGPMASSLADLVQLYEVMGGPDEAAGPKPYRVGLPRPFFDDVVHPDVARAVGGAASALAGAGVGVHEVDGEGLTEVRDTWSDVCFPEFWDAHPALHGDLLSLVDPQVASWLEGGRDMSDERRAEAVRRRAEVGRWYRSRLEGRDALLIPTTAYPAPRAEARSMDLGDGRTVDLGQFGPGWITCSVNLAGLPAINLPAAMTAERLPVGVSLVGLDDDETTLFELARLWWHGAGY